MYDVARNPEGAFIEGVPLRDLTAAEFVTLPEWLQRSVEVCWFYVRTRLPIPGRESALEEMTDGVH